MSKSIALDELLTLIKLLKAEGVSEYSNNGLILKFSPREQHQDPRSGEVRGPEAPPEAPEGASDSEAAAVVIPDALKRLNSNYLKLSGISPRGK